MNTYSISEIENLFFNHCASHGVVFSDKPLNADGVLHRCHVDGDKRGTKNGAYIIHADGKPSGWFRHFSSGAYGTWTLSGKREPMSSAMREQIRADRERRQIELAERHNDTADKARFIWHNAKFVESQSQHTYLIKKNIKPHGTRLFKGSLVIPICSERRELVNVQFIDADGGKRFLSGGKKKGCFSVIGKPYADSPILIAEGFATGASLHEDTGHFVVVAMDAGNLKAVALVIHRLYPDKAIVICGDHDESGVGQKAAQEAAIAVGGKVLIPETVGDWNDVMNGGGLNNDH